MEASRTDAFSDQLHGMWAAVAGAWATHAEYVDARGAQMTARMLELSAPQPGERVLELACGPGGLGLAAAPLVAPGGEVVLSDVVAEMTSIAARAEALGLANVTTCELDLDQIDQPDASYDVVLCREGLMFAVDPARAVCEMARVLRPSGRVAIAVWGPRERNPWLGLVLDAVSDQLAAPVPPPGIPGPFRSMMQTGWPVCSPTLRSGTSSSADLPTPRRTESFDEWWTRTVVRLPGRSQQFWRRSPTVFTQRFVPACKKLSAPTKPRRPQVSRRHPARLRSSRLNSSTSLTSDEKKRRRMRWAAAVGEMVPERTSFSSARISAATAGSLASASSSPSFTSDHIQSRAWSARRAERAARAQRGLVLLDDRPDPVDALTEQRRDPFDPHLPTLGARPQEVQRVRVVGCGALGGGGQIAVGLVHHHEVGELDDPPLHALQLVAGARPEQQHEQVDHARDRDLRLADTDRLDQHDVEARGLAQQQRLARAPRDATERSARRRRADERLGAPRQLLHAGLVAEDRAAAAGARRIDREHRDAMSGVDEVQAERLDERRLPAPGAPLMPTRPCACRSRAGSRRAARPRRRGDPRASIPRA